LSEIHDNTAECKEFINLIKKQGSRSTMSWLITYLNSSVGKKNAMAVTGILLCGFLVSHVLGNFLLFVGPDAFNTYAYTLTSNPLIYVAEAILLAIFLSHLALAARLNIENYKARPSRYFVSKTCGEATFASRTMPITGAIIFIFLIIHLLQFKFGAYYETTVDGVIMRDLYKLVIESFENPLNVALYVFVGLATAVHVTHGFKSAFQSLGFNHPKYSPLIGWVSCGFALFIALGYCSLPIYCGFQGGQ
jgi:succinate dehydrogenase / fumarate reductase cytochrome b subunit